MKMINNKKQLILAVRKIGEQKIEQGILFKQFALIMEKTKDTKTLKEWRDIVGDFVE